MGSKKGHCDLHPSKAASVIPRAWLPLKVSGKPGTVWAALCLLLATVPSQSQLSRLLSPETSTPILMATYSLSFSLTFSMGLVLHTFLICQSPTHVFFFFFSITVTTGKQTRVLFMGLSIFLHCKNVRPKE